MRLPPAILLLTWLLAWAVQGAAWCDDAAASCARSDAPAAHACCAWLEQAGVGERCDCAAPAEPAAPAAPLPAGREPLPPLAWTLAEPAAWPLSPAARSDRTRLPKPARPAGGGAPHVRLPVLYGALLT